MIHAIFTDLLPVCYMDPIYPNYRDAMAAQAGSSKDPQSRGVQPTLEVAGQRRIPGPTNEQIREAVLSLDATTTYAFLIMDRDARHSMEISGDAKEGFDIEHYDGVKGRRYRAEGDFTTDQVVSLIIAYRDAAAGWEGQMKWVELDE